MLLSLAIIHMTVSHLTRSIGESSQMVPTFGENCLRQALHFQIRRLGATREVVIVRGAVSPDHIHMLLSAPTKLVQYVKGGSSRRLPKEFRNYASVIGGSTCVHEDTFARRWARWMRKRSRPVSRISDGTTTPRASRLPAPTEP